jgi:hypothetical protein
MIGPAFNTSTCWKHSCRMMRLLFHHEDLSAIFEAVTVSFALQPSRHDAPTLASGTLLTWPANRNLTRQEGAPYKNRAGLNRQSSTNSTLFVPLNARIKSASDIFSTSANSNATAPSSVTISNCRPSILTSCTLSHEISDSFTLIATSETRSLPPNSKGCPDDAIRSQKLNESALQGDPRAGSDRRMGPPRGNPNSRSSLCRPRPRPLSSAFPTVCWRLARLLPRRGNLSASAPFPRSW